MTTTDETNLTNAPQTERGLLYFLTPLENFGNLGNTKSAQ